MPEFLPAALNISSEKAPESDVKKKLSFKEKFEFEQLEKDIARLESEKSKITALLNSNSENHEEMIRWSEEIGKIIAELDEKSMRWLELSEGL